MATLPNVPPVPDADRVTFVVTNAPITLVPVPFPVYGVQEDLTVILNNLIADPATWTFTSASGASLTVLPLPITDGLVTFNSPVIGTIEVVGNWQPRQVIQPSAPGIARREFNQVISMIISGMREIQRLIRLALQFVQTDSLGNGYYNALGFRIANVGDAVLAQDAVNLETLSSVLAGYSSSGSVGQLMFWTFTADGSTLTFPLTASGKAIPAGPVSYIVTANGLTISPASYTINQTAQTLTFALAPPNGSAVVVRTSIPNLGTPGTTENAAARQASTSGSDTATLSDGLVYWGSPFAGAKTQHIPPAASAGQNFRLTIADALGDAATNPIVIVPSAGTINGRVNFSLTIGFQSVTLAAAPLANNWVIV